MKRELLAIRKTLKAERKLATRYPVSGLRAARQYKDRMDRAGADTASTPPEGKSLGFLNYDISYLGDREFLVMIDEIFVNNLYALQTSAAAPVILDCGSNIGLFVLFIKSLHPEARITAFEPSARSFDLLSRNVSKNNVTVVSLQNCALVGAPTSVDFFVSDNRAASLRASIFRNGEQARLKLSSGRGYLNS